MSVFKDLFNAVELFGREEIVFETKKFGFLGEHLVTNYFAKLRNLYHQCRSFEPSNLSYEEWLSAGRPSKEILPERLKHLAREKLENYGVGPIASRQIISTTLSTGQIIYPYDFIVIDDAVFMKQFIFDDFGNFYKRKTIMFDNDYWYDAYRSINFGLLPEGRDIFSAIEIDTKQFLEKLSDAINLCLRPKYHSDIVRPYANSLELSPDCQHFVSVYLNKRLYTMAEEYQEGKTVTVQMIIKQNEIYSSYTLYISNRDGGTIIRSERTAKPVIELSKVAAVK